MDDQNEINDDLEPSGLELDRPVKPAPPSKPTSKPAASDPNLRAVRSAMRDRPLPGGPQPEKKLDGKVIKEGAVDTLLNSFSILSELVEDFRNSDRFFKYKVFIIIGWLMLSVTSLGVACGGRGPSNDINAVLVIAGDASRPVYLVKNESLEPWQDVEVLVNGQYRATLAQMEANGGSIALSSAVLFDRSGKKAPSNLMITDIVVTVSEPSEIVTLLAAGRPVK